MDESFIICVVLVQQRLVRDFQKILNEVKSADIPDNLKLPDSFDQLVLEAQNNQYDARTLALKLRAMVCGILQKRMDNFLNLHFWFLIKACIFSG